MRAELFPADEVRELTLARLASEIARSVGGVGRVAVMGEVVRPRRGASGWCYFAIRERSVQISAVCPAELGRRCVVVHGEKVRVTGTLRWQAGRGAVELVVEEVLPVGDGAIAAALARVRSRLQADGLFDRVPKTLPKLPRAIGVICGTDSAVRSDIESVVKARFAQYPIVYFETTVSGPAAATSIERALKVLDSRSEIEVIILARGGGDASSLLPFSDEELCRSIAAARCVTVSAIGHDGDKPLCDEVADLRFGTPSLAAAGVVPDRAALRQQLSTLRGMADQVVQALLNSANLGLQTADPGGACNAALIQSRHRLEKSAQRLEDVDLMGIMQRSRQRLGRCDHTNAARLRLEASGRRLGADRAVLSALSPLRILERGYAIVRDVAGDVVRNPATVSAGDVLALVLAGGEIQAAVLPQLRGSDPQDPANQGLGNQELRQGRHGNG